MKSRKKAEMDILAGVAIIVIVGLLMFYIISRATGKQAGDLLNTAKNFLPKNDKEKESVKETERVNAELQQNAKSVLDTFTIFMQKCVNSNPKGNYCECGNFDFTQLNDYYLKLTTGQNQVLELLDQNKVAMQHKDLGYFWIGPVNDESGLQNSGTREFYQSPDELTIATLKLPINYIVFSKESIIFNSVGQFEKSKGKMGKLNFIKINKGTQIKTDTIQLTLDTNRIIIDENTYGFEKCQ